ncbi:right-handed parallel beta-helix repeat-containing protein [Arthrobacter sp. D3-18]
MATRDVPTLDGSGRIFDKHIPPRLQDAALNATYGPDASTLKNVFGRSINVLSKGAVLDGVANDAPAFQSAINAAATFGLSVYFPPGTAKLGTNLIPKTGVTIEGEGGSSVFTSSSEIGAAIANPTGNLSDFTVRNVTFKGGATDLNQPRRRDRPVSSSFSQAIRIIGSGYNGVVAGDPTVYPVIKNITLDNIRIVNTKTLPFYFAGIQNVTVRDCFIRNCMDPGFVYVDGVDFSHNVVENSADNGVSVSRKCRNVVIADNVIRGTAHYGIWCAGFHSDVDGGIYAPGPENFTITGNTVEDSGKGGIALSDAPKHGVVSGNVISGVTNGNQDYPSVNDGVGIFITGYPSSLADPTIVAEDIIISDNIIKGAQRNGVGIRGAVDIVLDNNTFLDIGVENFVADYPLGGIVGGTAVSPTSTSYNCGIITSGSGMNRLTVTSNRFIDTRATPLSNYAIPANVRSSAGFYGRDNRSINYRQLLGATGTEFGESGALGYRVVINAAANQNKDLVWQNAGADRWIARSASTNAWQLSRRLSDGSQGSVPISVNWSNGEVTFGDPVILNQGAFIQDGKDLTIGTGTGSKIGFTNSKMGFYGATPVAKPTATPVAATDAATTQALVNDLRSKLIALGLIG